jgi:MOSC domain-containing protein YiiM
MHPCDGTVLRVASDAQHAFSKPLRQRITLIEGHGVEGDAHAGEYIRHRFIARVRPRQPNRRQVHLIRAELFNELREAGRLVGPSDLGENVTTTGLRLEHLPLGTKLLLGEHAVVQLTLLSHLPESVGRI